MKTLLVLPLLAVSLTSHALPRTSTAYTLSPESTNGGGSRTTSAIYSNEGSLGEIGGVASVSSPSVTILSGYIGALDVVGLVPGVITSPVTDLSATGATFVGEVTSEGGTEVTARGFVVGTDPDPTVENDSIVPAGFGTGTFTVPVTDLSPGTTYHLRAYATSEIGTGYGDNVFLTTDTNVNFVDGVASFSRNLLPGNRQVFRFTLSGPRIVSLSTLGGAAQRAELYDSERALITSFTGDANFDLEELLLAGAYALHIFREADGGDPQTFDLTIDASIVAATRPDVAVGASPARLRGRGLYSPSRQLVALISKRARRVTGYASFANRGKLPDVLAARASKGNAFFRVTYFGQGNITAALLTGTYRSGQMDESDTPVLIRARVTPNKKKLKKKKGKRTFIMKKKMTLLIRAKSTVDPTIRDLASIRVRTK